MKKQYPLFIIFIIPSIFIGISVTIFNYGSPYNQIFDLEHCYNINAQHKININDIKQLNNLDLATRYCDNSIIGIITSVFIFSIIIIFMILSNKIDMQISINNSNLWIKILSIILSPIMIYLAITFPFSIYGNYKGLFSIKPHIYMLVMDSVMRFSAATFFLIAVISNIKLIFIFISDKKSNTR